MSKKSAKSKKSNGNKQVSVDELYTDAGQIRVDAVEPEELDAVELEMDESSEPETEAPDEVKGKGAEEVKTAEAVDPLKAMEEKYVRLRAEYDNFIKRTAREKMSLATYGGKSMARAILPVLDDLKRTVDHARSIETTDKTLLKGAEMVLEKFEKSLETEGVKRLVSVGEKFDPELHDAMMRKPSEEHEEGIVIEEFEAGYEFNSQVIRHAKVVVSS